MANDFFSGFASGFMKTSAQTVLKNNADQEEIDNARKKAVALADPEADLYKRKLVLEAEQKDAQREKGYARIQELMNGQSPAASPTDDAQAVPEAVNPAVAATPFSSGGANTAPQADDIDSVFNDLQKYQKAQAMAEGAGDRDTAQYFNNLVDAQKQKMEYIKTKSSTAAKPVTGAEGGNIVEGIQKQYDTDVKNKTSTSRYLPTSLNQFVNAPGADKLEQEWNQKHQALAQAVASAKKEELSSNTPEVSSTIQKDTGNVIKNINTLNIDDKRVTSEMKAKAANDINDYLTGLSPIEQERLKANPNFKAVFTQDVQDKLHSFIDTGTTATTPAAPKAPTKPTAQPKTASKLSSQQALDIKAQYKAGKISRKEALDQLSKIQ